MKKITFLYIIAFLIGFITLPISNGEESIVTVIICSCLIGLVGLPHGAVDHILYSSLSVRSMYIFYVVYLSLMVAFIALWFIYPMMAMIIFLLISAYHFGESQLSFIKQSKLASMLHYFVWGIHLLSTYITYQFDALLPLFEDNSYMNQFVGLLSTQENQILLLYVSAISLFSFFAYLLWREKMTIQQVLQELYVLSLIHFSFYLFGPLVGFTLYFVILHSMKVIQDEFLYLKRKFNKLSMLKFAKLFIPFSVLSIFGLVLILCLNYWIIDLPIIYLFIILTSVITLPHTFVMHLFYIQD